ncbi:pentapeptide repeat-containing protein [Streptomyces sp. NPDC048272]|uniref:pentapeptide repeat-containing protein n=1 Tax=Streptomyces sp. NPDC048272 TaxID=3154616 RepID=UPI00341EC7E2
MKKHFASIAVSAMAAMLLLGAFAIVLWKGPWWSDGAHFGRGLTPGEGAVITGFRTSVVALGAGILAAGSLAYTHLNHRQSREAFTKSQENFTEQAELTRESLRQSESNAFRQAEISRESQVTDRYVSAIHLIASENKTEQIGGIYSLERIMRDSKKDHDTVVEVLAGFIRQHATAGQGNARSGDPIQAALGVLARRPRRDEPFRIDLRRVVLSECTIEGADFRNINLNGAYLNCVAFQECDLTSADLRSTTISQSRFSKCNMPRIELDSATVHQTSFFSNEAPELSGSFATFKGCRFAHTNLKGAYLDESTLHHTIFRRSDLEAADFQNACLYGVTFSPKCNPDTNSLLGAHIFESTRLPNAMLGNQEITARIQQVEQEWTGRGQDHTHVDKNESTGVGGNS